MAGKYNSEKQNRRSIRLKGYDYAQAGAYFVTICTQNRACLFGKIIKGKIELNDAGYMVENVWREFPLKYSGIGIDEFVIMPNHIHGIIILSAPETVGAGPRACPGFECSGSCPDVAYTGSCPNNEYHKPRNRCTQEGHPQGGAPTTLGDFVHRYKSFTTSKYRLGVYRFDWQPFPGRLWQRNYYEHIIRNETEMSRIRQYIIDNPAEWEDDKNNPERL